MQPLFQKNSLQFDAVIIGGGAAGLSAALWCADLGLSAILLERQAETGGQLLRVYNRIENHLGVCAENGKQLRDIFSRQLEDREVSLKMNAEIAHLDLEKKTVFLSGGEKISARALIIATGVSRRKLGIEGEGEFQEKGVLKSGKLEQNAVKNKQVAVIGGGDAALENALILAETAEKVVIIHRSESFRAREEFLEQAKNHPKIIFLTGTAVHKFTGKNKLEAVEIENLSSREISKMPFEAVLIRIGVQPNTGLFGEELNLDKSGYINIDRDCRTNLKGVWAIGDAANPNAPTVSSAVGMGATAVKSIYLYLNS